MKSIKRILYRAKHVSKKSLLSSKVTKSVFCLLLTLSLVLGTGVNLSYAAEFLPEGPEGVTISQTDNQVIVAPSARGGASATYEWQMYSPNLNDFALIGGATDSTLDVNYALVNNALNGENKTTIRCNVKDENGEVISSKDYNVSYNEPVQSVDEQVKQAAIHNAVSSMSFSTNYANGQSDEENADTVKIIIEYVDSTHPDWSLGITHEQTFAKKTYFDWNVQIRTETGHVFAEDPFVFEPTVAGLSATYADDDPLYNKSIYVKYQNTSAFPADIDTVKIKVKYVLDTADYYVKPLYENVNGGYDDTTPVQKCTTSIGSSIPDQDSINKLATEVYTTDPTGWTASKFTPMILSATTAAATDPEKGGTPIELKFNRSWTLCTFDLNGGYNGPAAVYVRHGANFKDVLQSSWPAGYPTQIPTRDKYTCTGWKANGEEPEIPVNTDFGVVPGEDTEYVAQWELALDPGAKVSVTIAYYTERANDETYEYSKERYSLVEQSMIGQEYTIPTPENPQTAPYNPAIDPQLDRRFPQVRASADDQYILKSNPSEVEVVPGTPNKTYTDLFTFDHCDSVVVKADGTAVCKVYLNRVKFTYSFYNKDDFTGTPNWTITGKWDQDISTEWEEINSAQTNGKSRLRPWKVKSTSEVTGREQECCYISNMGFANENYCIITEYSDSWKVYLYYYLQKPGTEWNIESSPSLEYFYGWSNDSYSNFDRIDVKTSTGSTTTIDEFINFLGFKTPTPRGETKGVGDYYGGANINNAGETYHPNNQYGPGYSTETNTRGAFIGSYDAWDANASRYRQSYSPDPDHNGLKYFYKRNKHQLYLRNIYGVEKSEYHEDYVAQLTTPDDDGSVNKGGVHYELPIADFVIQQTEYQDSGETGLTGITQGTSFLNYVPGTGSEGINDRPPSTVDQHLVFEGWYEDPAFTLPVTHYDYKTGVHTVVDNWTMPNHEQDLYAHWVAPDREIQFNTGNYKGDFTDETKYTENGKEIVQYLKDMASLDGQKVYPTQEELQAQIDSHPAYRFVGYYYYASAEDKTNDVKTFFDPFKMQMPWCDYSELGTSNADIPRIVVHQYWVTEDDVDYETRFVLSDDTNGQTLVADTMIGRDAVGSSVTVKALDPRPEGTPDAFRLDFRGIIEIDTTKSPETEKTITLEPWTGDVNPNIVTFYYTYKAEGSDFQYKVRHYCHTKDQDTGVYTMTHEDEQATTTENHANVATIYPPTKPVIDPPLTLDPDDFSLQSPETITTTLELNTVNYINIYYTEVDPVILTYNMATLDYTGASMTSIVGGSLDKASQSIKVSQADDAMCFAQANPAFSITWYYSGADGSYDLAKPVESEWITNTLDGKVKIHPPTVEGIYLENATYWAVFKENAPIYITYNAQTVNNPTELLARDYSCGASVSPTSDSLDHAINAGTVTLSGSTASQGTKATFIAWATKNADGTFTIISGTEGVSEYKPTGQTASDGQGHEYTYYDSADYYALFYENAVTVNYKVNDGQSSFGNIQVTGQSAGQSGSESLYPHESTASVGATAIANKYYHFVNWTLDGTEVSTNKFFQPEKSGTPPVFSGATYVANFAQNDPLTAAFETDGNGTIENDETTNIVAGASFDVLSDNTIKLYSLNLDHPGATPVPDEGKQFLKWTIFIEGVECDLADLPSNELNDNVTFKAYFGDEPVPPTPPTPDPDNPVIVNAQTGDSSLGLIIGLIAIILVAGGVTYVVARKRKSYKPKHK